MLALFYAGATALFTAAYLFAGAGIFSYAGLTLGALHLLWQTRKLDIADPDTCLRLFRSNRDYGWIVFAGLVLDAVVGMT